MSMINALKRQVALQSALLMRHATRSLRAFVEQAWPILEPTRPFLPNWHIDLLSEYLEAVTAGEITRLLINLPPRYMKSLLVSVLWPTWEWIQKPERPVDIRELQRDTRDEAFARSPHDPAVDVVSESLGRSRAVRFGSECERGVPEYAARLS